MAYWITVLPEGRRLEGSPGETLLSVLRAGNVLLDAPCAGNGSCGKCKVLIDGKPHLACKTVIDRDMTLVLPERQDGVILTDGIESEHLAQEGVCLAVDIGTTTVAAYLTEKGQILATESRKNPQSAFGADVVSRIHQARKGQQSALTGAIRACLAEITASLLEKTGAKGIDRVCIVGNPAMQQLFMGLPVDNLTTPPFTPLLQKAQTVPGGQYIPAWEGSMLWNVPDIAGYIGADTVACILATGMDRSEKLSLLVDIGTNGEMVLGNKDRLIACATAAGPALEGAGIAFGMQAGTGAIDRVSRGFACHVLGDTKALGICGSGLLDAVAVALEQDLINERGRILNPEHTLPLADGVFLTQEDIRQLQQAKGAIAAGIRLMVQELGVSLRDIENVYLAGAFGTFMDPRSACRIGMIPAELEEKILPVGNAAGSGARMIAGSRQTLDRAEAVATGTKCLELATLPGWAKAFAQGMRFENETDYWCHKAMDMGFTHAVPMDPGKLTAREDVRAMCAADKCGAYGKNWTCPPHCGTLKECEEIMSRYGRGILLQSVGRTEKIIDSRAYRETEKRHLQQFAALADAIRARHPDALCLGSGGCRICKKCAWPEPCRFPEKACASMEGYGLFVTQVCRDNGLAYHHGERTVTYTACVLF